MRTSLIAATFSGAVASGESIAGIGTLPGSVLYIDAENGAWEIHRRVHDFLPILTRETLHGARQYERGGLPTRSFRQALFGPIPVVP
jgi:hypothetical protein